MIFIDGNWMEMLSGEKLKVNNPATNETLREIGVAGSAETRTAIEAANKAFSEWKAKTAKERGDYLKTVAQQLRKKREELAETVTKEMGKPLKEAMGEVSMAADYFEWYGEEAKRMYGETIPASKEDKRLLVLQQPVGVVGAITPWNFPVAMLARKMAPALAAGCTVVVKPAPATPLSAIAVFEAFDTANMPNGTVNLLIGPAEKIGVELTKNPLVKKLTFTGSTEVGKKLTSASSETMKKVSMELGGHAPFVVFEDSDIDEAVKGAVANKFRNAGQTCVCTNRVYVSENIADTFAEKLVKAVSELKVGNGLVEDIDVGPLINEQALEKVEKHIGDAVSKGASLLYGGQRLKDKDGFFFEPTVLCEVDEEMLIASEETFGPVVPIFTFKTENEAYSKANHHQYGLAAYVYTSNLSRAYRSMDELEYGIVGINDPMPTVVQAPFGGIKESGSGKEGGRHGMKDYLEEKFISIQL